jgi:cellulose synthase/poly-beta-1,6-N-acetylglucosamine synthase-like glycosyltransferase
MPHVTAVQGAVLIDRGGPWLLRNILNAMEWCSWCLFAPGISMLVGSGYFGGACAAWRPDALRALGFDTAMQTEDIDLSIRALSQGHLIQMAPHAQSVEMCPVDLRALYRQRLRWAIGWEEVTHVRLASVFGSPKISEPRKWRVSLLLMARYLTLFTSIFGVGQIIDSLFYARTWPPPLHVAMSFPSAFCITLGLYSAWLLVQLRAPLSLWVGVFFFQVCSPVFFFLQSSLIVVATVRLALTGSKPIEWVATKRGKHEPKH